jgi:prepilin signal peptidase PulO-like enzyme (type II secretory pathway)
MNIILSSFTFLFGLAIGSFLNALIWRLHTRESLIDRSHCPKCGHKISWYDNIPLLSFLLLRGRCRHCHERISIQYPLVELMTGLLFVLAYYRNFGFWILDFRFVSDFGFRVSDFLELLRDWFVIAVMIVIFIYDLRWYLILDVVSLPAAGIILASNLYLGNTTYNICRLENLWSCNALSWSGMLISAIIGGSFFLAQFIVSRGRWIGGGDIRLGLLMGLILGWPYILVGLMIAYFLGSVVGLGLVAANRKKWGSQIPFGVFLTTATVITMFWGSGILKWYLGIFQ